MSCNPLPLPQRESLMDAASPTRAECGWFIRGGSLEIPKTGQPLQAGGALWASFQAAAQWAEAFLGLFPRRKKALKSGVTTVERDKDLTSRCIRQALLPMKQRAFKFTVNPSAALL